MLRIAAGALFIAILFSGCFGSKKDPVVDDIFEQGKIDPRLVPNNVGYVPVLPFFTGVNNPTDVFVGYDEMVYVTDDAGLRVLDQTGKIVQTIPIPGASDVTQDRRLHTWVAGRVPIIINGQQRNLAAVYHLTGTATSQWQVIDTLIHPFCDGSRIGGLRGPDDEKVEFTGLACTHDNQLYVSRKGPAPENPPAIADNNILIFSKDGQYKGYTDGLNTQGPSLRSVAGISGIAGFAAPPQRVFGISTNQDILLTLDHPDPSFEYRSLWIRRIEDPDLGTLWQENAGLLSQDTAKASGFLYTPYKFKAPTDIFAAPDQNAYIFITDAGTDSLYQFTNRGYEGVNPPAGFQGGKQIIASFGGKGDGPFQFNDPSGVCYFRRMIFVADKNNHRICRYKLNADIE